MLCIFQSLFCNDEVSDREFAVDTILSIRKGSECGDMTVRARRTPLLNKKAESVKDLIDWSKEKIFEAVLSCCLSTTELNKMKSEKMIVLKFPVHGQSIEHCVPAVTQASSSVFEHEQRDVFIKATLDHRKLMPTQQ